MLNLLPQTEKKTLINEYRLRFAATAASFGCLLMIVAIVGLLPTYLRGSFQMEMLQKQKLEVEAQNSAELLAQADQLSSSNRSVANYLKARIASFQATPPDTELIGLILGKKTEGITLGGIDIAGKQVRMQGMAATRADLIAFHNALRQEPLFKSAALPIGDIAKSTKAEFAITIQLP